MWENPQKYPIVITRWATRQILAAISEYARAHVMGSLCAQPPMDEVWSWVEYINTVYGLNIADEEKIEMMFWEEVEEWKKIHKPAEKSE